ncbi:MAG: hypothetical protein KBT02_00940 [Treponema sp.]|nr:hypothetical protein [Candidatus Treponema caballi]
MNVIILNGSPKPSGGNSAYLIECLKRMMELSNQDLRFTMLNIRNNMISEPDYQLFESCDAFVIASPVYFNGLPSHLLEQLVRLDDYFNGHKGIKSHARGRMNVYGLMNCGYFDGNGCALALEMIEQWAVCCGLNYSGGSGFGGGEMLGMITAVPFGKGPLKTPGKVMQKLSDAIVTKTAFENAFATPDYPRFIFMNNANMLMWEKRAKENGITKKQLYYRIP